MPLNLISAALKGLCVGGTMLVPGISGGSMAMVLGIYDSLIKAVSSFFENARKNLVFLLSFSAGAFIGMALFAKPLFQLIQQNPMLMMYFFIGAVSGGVPMICRKANVKKASIGIVFYPAAGTLFVVLFSLVPKGLFHMHGGQGAAGLLLLFAAGLIAAVALVLPGISVSYLLLMMGLYEKTMQAVGNLELGFLLPLGGGIIAGIILSTKLLERALTNHAQAAYLMILGFVIGSVAEVFPGFPAGAEWIFCIAAFTAGFGLIQMLHSFEKASAS